MSLTPLVRAWYAARMGVGQSTKMRAPAREKATAKSSEQKTAEAEVDSFRKNLGPFVVAAETTRMPMAFTDAQVHGQPIIFANDSFLELTGYEREEILGERFNRLLAGGNGPAVLA